MLATAGEVIEQLFGASSSAVVVRFGSKADIRLSSVDVRLPPKADIQWCT
jgi:hypothetical protein